jgi:PAS domain S-box-containing protein
MGVLRTSDKERRLVTFSIHLMQYANAAAITALTIACLVQWRRRSEASIRWATGAFGSLAVLSIIGLVLQQPSASSFFLWLIKGILVALVLCPYFLYRFAVAFEPVSRRVGALAFLVTASVAAATFAVPYLPFPGMPEPTWWSLYRFGFLVQWTILFAIVVVRLWGGSRHEASVARRRMRTLATAAAAMNAGLLLSSVVRGPGTPTTHLITQVIFLVASILFFVGLAPPQWLLRQWRRPEELAMRTAMTALVAAETQAEMAEILLPRAAQLVAARGAALMTSAGDVLATYGSAFTEAELVGVHRVEMRTGTLLIWTSPYAPFFGPDEFAMTQSLGAFADLAMERFTLLEATKKAAARFKSLLESAPDSMVIIDHDGKIVLVNRQAEQLFGYTAADLVGEPVEVLIPARFRDLHGGHRAHFAAEPRVRSMGQGWELFAVRSDGTEVPVEISLSPIEGDEGPLVSAAIRDITERKQREDELALALTQAQEASLLKSAFLANMSHEIRTPMNGVMGMVGLLLDTELNDEQRDYIETMAGSAEALLVIIGDILDLSKIEAGKLSLEDEPFDLRASIDAGLVPLRVAAQEKGLQLAVTFAEDVPDVVSGDRLRLRQVLSNLITNAVKFTDAGEVLVIVGRAGGDQLRVDVVDTGIGISPERRAALFEPFVQGDTSTTRRYGGSGLGLAICRQVVGLMGGEIGVESCPDKGSRFWFTIPLHVVQDDEPVPSPVAAAPDARLAVGTRRVLVVEDNAVNRKVAVAYLDKLGYVTDIAVDGCEALDAMSTTNYDVVLMDCQMPRMDGYEASLAVRAREHDRHTPIVAMTASAMASDRERCLAAGMDDYLSKPLNRELLAATLQRWMAEQSAPANH